MNNADRIRAMTNEELAEFLLGWDCEYALWITSDGEAFDEDNKESAISHEIEWLESEVDNG